MKRAVYYFSLRSPYSWLAHHDLLTRYPDVADAVEWRPFWEPSAENLERLHAAGGRFVYTPMSREKHRYILQDVRRLAAARGLTVTWPVDRDPVWEVPHLPYFTAAAAGVGRQYLEAVYRARWQEGRDVCDPKVIAEICASLGIDPEAGPSPETVTAALLDIHRDDVFGVPFFIYGWERFWGVDRLAAFAAAVRADRPEPPEPEEEPPVAAEARSSDLGHAGGCG